MGAQFMKAKRHLFFLLGAGLLIYGIVQIGVTTSQIYASDFSAEIMTHPQILLMGALHFAAAFLGLISMSWSRKFAATDKPQTADTREALVSPSTDEPQASDEPADAL